MPRVTESCWW